MEVILDTNGLSAWLGGDESLKLKLIVAPGVWLSPIVLGEYRFGIKASRDREVYERKLAELAMDIPILPIDAATSTSYAEIQQDLKKTGKPIPWHDVWIAAQAKQHGFGIVSRDGHFDFVQGITRLSWQLTFLIPRHSLQVTRNLVKGASPLATHWFLKKRTAVMWWKNS